ncbi:MAG TPA: hypothetical protein VKA19_02400 [Alphaproteobacteria bacterium]|nr:hypothetical protein [Alphaproteobacteria bacterium]
MANINSTQYKNVYVDDPAKVLHGGEYFGRLRRAVAEISTGSATSGDTYTLLKLPRNAMLHNVKVYNAAVTGETDLDVGDENDVDGLFDGIDISSAGSKELVADGGTNGYDPQTDSAKKLWEVLGYSKETDAPENVKVIATSSGNAADVNVAFVFEYVVD